MAQLAGNTTLLQQTRRSARQQSREPEQIRPGSPLKGRRSGRSARNASANLEAASIDPGLGFNADIPNENDLEAVPEESQEQHDHEVTLFVNDHVDPRSPGARSNYSGATAVTSHSATEITMLRDDGRAADFSAAVIDLVGRANSVLYLLTPKPASVKVLSDLATELQKPGSPSSRLLHSRQRKLDESFVGFANGKNINPISVLHAALGTKSVDEIGHGLWRPDGLLQKANLARLAAEVVPKMDRSGVGSMELEQIDQVFPTPFMHSFTAAERVAPRNIPAGQSKQRDTTFNVALAIRTQLALALLEFGSQNQSQPLEPDEIIRQVFLATSSNGETLVPKKWSINFGGKELPLTDAMDAAIIERVNEIRAFWHGDMEPDYQALDQRYPWSSFKQQFVGWVRQRSDEIETGIAICKGVDEIAASWEKEIDIRANEPEQTPFQSATNDAVRLVHKNKRSRKKSKQSGDFVPNLHEEGQDYHQEKPRGVVNGSIPVDPQLQHDRQQAALRIQQGMPHRGRSLLDSQPGATKVIFDDSQLSQTPRSPLKRRREIGDEDASQDLGFQTDDRSADNIAQRRQAVQLANQAQEAEVRRQNEEQQLGRQLGQELGHDYAGPMSDPPAQEHPGTQAQSQAQAQNATPAQTPGDYYRSQVQPLAKQITAVRSQSRPQQSRTPWDTVEVDALHALVARFASSYAKAKKADEEGPNLLARRDAEAMRHKARNIKFDYLKSGCTLPEGFPWVLLDKKFKDKLAALGIDYDQEQARSKRRIHHVQEGEDAEPEGAPEDTAVPASTA